MKMKYVCPHCSKEYKDKKWFDNHVEKCESKSVEELLDESYILPSEKEESPLEEEKQVLDPELVWLKGWSETFNPANISVTPELTKRLDFIYLEFYGKKRGGSCSDQIIRMYMYLFRAGQKI